MACLGVWPGITRRVEVRSGVVRHGLLAAKQMSDELTRERFHAGMAAVDCKDWDAAAEAFWGACRRDPNNVNILFNLANARLQSGDKRGARWAVDRAMCLEVGYPNLRFLAGNVAVENGDPQAAIPHYVAAIWQDPQNAAIHTNLASTLEQLKLFEEAYEVYDFAIDCGGDRTALLSAMHHVAQNACRWDLATSAKRRFDELITRGAENHASPFQMLCM